jgi:hypothetical protein
MTIVDVLEEAWADIHSAVTADGWRRHEYARSARDYAVTVLLATDATPEQRDRAGYYFAEAEELAKRSAGLFGGQAQCGASA